MTEGPESNPPPHVLGDGEKIEMGTRIRQGPTVMTFGEWVELTMRSRGCNREEAATLIMEQIQQMKMVIQP